MKKALVGTLVALLVCGLGFSLSREEIKGRVLDDDGKPLPGVKVQVLDTEISAETGEDGTFVLRSPENTTVFLLFSHPDYETRSVQVELGKARAPKLQVSLKAKNPMLLTIKEEIMVTAEADSIIDVSLPSHRTILPHSVLAELGTSTVAESVDKVPGVAAVGKGGYSMVPAVRGLAEHRVLLLVDGVRITSERRIGASASFISLDNIDRIEVNRGPYSVFYGSGAVGGIVHVITKSPMPYSPLKGDVQFGYNTAKRERAGSFHLSGSLGDVGFMLTANGKKADDYASPQGKVEQSRYSDMGFLFKVNREKGNSRIHATCLHYRGTDIGKPSPSARFKPRWYPHEGNTLFTVGVETRNRLSLDTLSAAAYVLRSSLETRKENLREEGLSLSKRNVAEVEGTNYGFKIRGGKELGTRHTLNFGMDFFGRAGVRDSNREWRYDPDGNVLSEIRETSLDGARRSNWGVYVDDKIRVVPSLSVEIGARFDIVRTSNRLLPGGERVSRRDESVSAYTGLVMDLAPGFSLVANVGRSFRFPSVSELFYTGLTGRGTVFGNPDLRPEKGLNLDLGFRYLHERFFGSLYAFRNRVSDIVEKYAGPGEEEYFYRNLSAGRIFGMEGEFYFALHKNLELFVNFHVMQGREEKTDRPINYIPPSRLTFWVKFSRGPFWIEPKVMLAAAKSDPGPLEREIDGYALLDSICGFRVSRRLTLMAIFTNLLNATYYASADEKGVLAPGRSLVLRVNYGF